MQFFIATRTYSGFISIILFILVAIILFYTMKLKNKVHSSGSSVNKTQEKIQRKITVTICIRFEKDSAKSKFSQFILFFTVAHLHY